jgi:glutathione peroxidase
MSLSKEYYNLKKSILKLQLTTILTVYPLFFIKNTYMMKRIFFPIALVSALFLTAGFTSLSSLINPSNMPFTFFKSKPTVQQEVETVYQFTVKDLYGKEVSLADYKGKVLLIVNTASKCGLTPQLKGLEALYETYKDRGLVVLGFPSNDFAGQEPLEGEAIAEFCSKNYGVTFPVFDKVKVKGQDACPLYQFLADISRNGKVDTKPGWNFHKYLIDREGRVQDYFASPTSPDAEKIRKAIEALL